MSTPQTNIYICAGVRLDSRFKHSIYFANQSDQISYFGGKVVKTFPAYSYCRKSWSIKVDDTMENARRWNYLYFRNTATGKYWFYFVDNIEYVNDNTVELFLELDVIQTYLFDWKLLPCYIERQHTPKDYVGMNQIDEGLDVGELHTYATRQISELHELCVLILSSLDLRYGAEDGGVKILSSNYNGVFGGLGVFAVSMTDWQALGAKLLLMDEAGATDAIVAMWMYPKKLVTLSDGSWDDEPVCKPVKSLSALEGSVSVPFGFPTYTPKNKKLYQYPFNFMQVSNNNGGGAVYRFERFGGITKEIGSNLDITFKCYGAYSPEGAVKLVFNNYNNFDYETGITLTGFPTCAWDADTYKIWLAQNQNQHATQTATSALTIFAGLATAGVGVYTGNVKAVAGGAGMVVSGSYQIASLNAQKKDMELQPPQARGSFSGSVNKVAARQTFSVYVRQVTSEHAKIIDDFFTMYGYAQRNVATPNINARPAFTYVKTIDCTIGGNIGNADRVRIEGIFDAGITFWKDGDKVGDYTQDNSASE